MKPKAARDLAGHVPDLHPADKEAGGARAQCRSPGSWKFSAFQCSKNVFEHIWDGWSNKDEGLMDMHNSVVIAGGGGCRELNGKGKNTMKIK